MPHCKRLLPVDVKEPHLIPCLGRIGIGIFFLGTHPAGSLFMPQSYIEGISSYIYAIR